MKARAAVSLAALLMLVALLTLANAPAVIADEIQVAVASNFAHALRDIATRFEQQTQHRVTLSAGSTGKHYAQIKNGAPFDAFFAADRQRPELLEKEGLAIPGNRFTYAIGKLVLWSPEKEYVDPAGAVLENGDFRYLAMANPKLAPYGRAAQEVLEARGQWQSLQERIVRGENISQALQFVVSGNAELGFVAWSQIHRPGLSTEGSWWEVPQELYTPIEQQALLLRDDVAVRAFVEFVRSAEAVEIIRANGYGTP